MRCARMLRIHRTGAIFHIYEYTDLIYSFLSRHGDKQYI